VTKRNEWAMHKLLYRRPERKAPPGEANGA
jgi:hypothetical protein